MVLTTLTTFLFSHCVMQHLRNRTLSFLLQKILFKTHEFHVHFFYFYIFQILIVAIVIVATFVIPISHLNQLHSGWIYATLVGNCLFIVLQMVCLIDSTGSICKNLDKIASRSRWWAFVEVCIYLKNISI